MDLTLDTGPQHTMKYGLHYIHDIPLGMLNVTVWFERCMMEYE